MVKLSDFCCVKPKKPKTAMKETPWFTGWGGGVQMQQRGQQMFPSHLGKQSPTTPKYHRLVRGENTEEKS